MLLGVVVAGVSMVIHWPLSSVAFSFGAARLSETCGFPDPVACAPSPGIASALIAGSALLSACSLWVGMLVALPSVRRRPGRAFVVTLVMVTLGQILLALTVAG